MNTRYDIHRELFRRLAEGNSPCGEHRPAVNHEAMRLLQEAASTVNCHYYNFSDPGMRAAAMDAAVAAIRLVYSIDDALS